MLNTGFLVVNIPTTNPRIQPTLSNYCAIKLIVSSDPEGIEGYVSMNFTPIIHEKSTEMVFRQLEVILKEVNWTKSFQNGTKSFHFQVISLC